MNTAKLKAVPRHSVDGYGRQDISYNDPEGEFVFYSDYEALKDALEAAHKRIAELEESHAQVIQARDFYKRANEAAMKSTAKLDSRAVTLPRPACTYADHSYPAYSEQQVIDLLKSAGINLETGGE
ncbi:ead/Ea22-like family protein [Cronobacter turicensis]